MSLGLPPWLADLMQRAGWDTPYVEMVELGEDGRGVKHPTLGWVSTNELRLIAATGDKKDD